jgi:hypothetical protein
VIPHSAAYDDAIVAGAKVDVRLTAYRLGQPVVESGLHSVGLAVAIDETSPSVRQLGGAIADPDGNLRPHVASDPGAQATTDPWQNLVALAGRYARTAIFDPVGQLVLRPVPDPATVPTVYEYVPGPRNLARPATPMIDTTGVHNVAVVTWSGSGVDATDLATVIVEVTDPTSPVFPQAFGRVPYFLTSNLFTDVSQLAPAGQAILAREALAAKQVPFTAVPHPAHEPGDAVHYRSDLGGVDEVCALARWQLALDLRTAAAYTTRVLR